MGRHTQFQSKIPEALLSIGQEETQLYGTTEIVPRYWPILVKAAHLDEQVQGTDQAALCLADALVYLVKVQLGVGLEARLQPSCWWAVGEQQLKGQEAQT